MAIDVYSPMSRCVETPHKCTKFAREAKIQNTEEITFQQFHFENVASKSRLFYDK